MNTEARHAILRSTMKADDFTDFKQALVDAKHNHASTGAGFNEAVRQSYTAKRAARASEKVNTHVKDDMLQKLKLVELLQGMRAPV